MPSQLAMGMALQLFAAVVLIVGDRLGLLSFDVATVAFPVLLALGVLVAVAVDVGKVTWIGRESTNWILSYGGNFAFAIVLFWIVRAVAD
mgnify:CR=1 FL=1